MELKQRIRFIESCVALKSDGASYVKGREYEVGAPFAKEMIRAHFATECTDPAVDAAWNPNPKPEAIDFTPKAIKKVKNEVRSH